MEAVNTNFKVTGLTRLEIKPESTAGALATTPQTPQVGGRHCQKGPQIVAANLGRVAK